MSDFDRRIDASGRIDAAAIGEAMRQRNLVPDITLCSSAVRTRETLECLVERAALGPATFVDRLYSEDASGYLAVIRENAVGGSMLVIGHNPMMEDLATALSGTADEAARSRLSSGFPTAGLAVIDFEEPLAEAAPHKGWLRLFITPHQP